jgi:hypothetical protein
VEPTWTLVAILAGAVAVLVLLLWLRGGRDGRQSRRRQRRADRGEARAERLLRRQGYRIEERQASVHWTMEVDGEPVEVEARADLLVRRKGRLYVAEVKTGTRATDPCHPRTRRQLLEYALVYDVDGVLLVDMEAKEVFEVGFDDLFG